MQLFFNVLVSCKGNSYKLWSMSGEREEDCSILRLDSKHTQKSCVCDKLVPLLDSYIIPVNGCSSTAPTSTGMILNIPVIAVAAELFSQEYIQDLSDVSLCHKSLKWTKCQRSLTVQEQSSCRICDPSCFFTAATSTDACGRFQSDFETTRCSLPVFQLHLLAAVPQHYRSNFEHIGTKYPAAQPTFLSKRSSSN